MPYALLPAVAFVVMLIGSWQRWTSMIVDLGRETDLPYRLMSGEVLYRDIHYIYPPFSPYFNALLYWIFGPSLTTLSTSGIIFAALLTLLCYRLARRLMEPLKAAIAVSLIVVLCFFKPAGNLVLPYSFAGVHAAVFSLTALLALMRFEESRRRIDLVISGVCVGLAAITKQEFAFASAIAVALGLVFLHRSDFKGLAIDALVSGVPAALISGAVFGLLFANIDARTLIDDCHLFYTNIPESLVFYNRFRSGLDHPVASIAAMIGGAAVAIAGVAAISAASDRLGIIRRSSFGILMISVVLTALILAFFYEDWDGSPLRALPFLLLGAMVYEWLRPRGTEGERLKSQALFVLAAYSLAILARVVLRVPSGGFSGSFYLPTSIVVIVYYLLDVLPRAIARWTNDPQSSGRAGRITTAVCLIAMIVMSATFVFRYRTRYGYPLSAERGSLLGEKYSGKAIEQAFRFIEQETAPGEVIAVLPEGNDIAFMTGRRINLRHQVLIPDFMTASDEQQAIDALERDNVRYVFILNRAMREFGKVEFGRDFYTVLGGYIDREFELVRTLGIEDGETARTGEPPFWIKVYRRR